MIITKLSKAPNCQGVVEAIQLLHRQAKKPRVQATIVPLVPLVNPIP